MPQQSLPKIISGNANPKLSKDIVKYINKLSNQYGKKVKLVDAKIERFNDQEVYVEVYANVRGRDLFIVQPTSKPANDHLMEILIIADALRRSSAARVTAVIPYFGYARQDRRTRARTPISAKLVANLITNAGIARVLTMDLHSAQLQGFFDIPVDNLYASPIFSLDINEKFSEHDDDVVVVSPDVGGVGRARELAKRINTGLAVVDKRRSPDGEVVEMTVIGEVENRICVIVDDICDTAGTICNAANYLLASGAREVHAYVTHGVMSGDAIKKIEASSLKSIVMTDTILPTSAIGASEKVRIMSTAPLFAQAINNIAIGTSISSLFKTKTLNWLYNRSK